MYTKMLKNKRCSRVIYSGGASFKSIVKENYQKRSCVGAISYKYQMFIFS